MCETKKCSKCGDTKLLEKFYKNSRNKSGRDSWCKDCKGMQQAASPEYREYQAKYREKHRDARREYDKALAEAYPERKREIHLQAKAKNNATCAEYKANNKQKIFAHNLINHEIAAGRYDTPTICEFCGTTTNLEYHHPDYSKPMQVISLCVRCHQRLHSELRKEEAHPVTGSNVGLDTPASQVAVVVAVPV